MDLWAWAILLLVFGLSLVILEVFVPSGGALGFLAACSIISAIVLGFMDGPRVGFAMLGTSAVGVPVVIVLALYVWPSTPMGRRMLLGTPTDADVLPDSPQHRQLKALIDREGVAKTRMLPSGAVTVDGRTINAVSEGVPVDAGQRVRVIDVHGNRVVVRPIDDASAGPDSLSRPIEAVGLDPFDDPLG